MKTKNKKGLKLLFFSHRMIPTTFCGKKRTFRDLLLIIWVRTYESSLLRINGFICSVPTTYLKTNINHYIAQPSKGTSTHPFYITKNSSCLSSFNTTCVFESMEEIFRTFYCFIVENLAPTNHQLRCQAGVMRGMNQNCPGFNVQTRLYTQSCMLVPKKRQQGSQKKHFTH